MVPLSLHCMESPYWYLLAHRQEDEVEGCGRAGRSPSSGRKSSGGQRCCQNSERCLLRGPCEDEDVWKIGRRLDDPPVHNDKGRTVIT